MQPRAWACSLGEAARPGAQSPLERGGGSNATASGDGAHSERGIARAKGLAIAVSAAVYLSDSAFSFMNSSSEIFSSMYLRMSSSEGSCRQISSIPERYNRHE